MRILILAATAAMALAGAAQAQPQGGGRMDPAAMIKAADKDGDGAVSKSEWTAAGRPAERFDMVDGNKDGKVTADEATAAMARMRQAGGQTPPAAPSGGMAGMDHSRTGVPN